MAYGGEEVVIGYNVADVEFVKKVADTLRNDGMTVWHADFKSKTEKSGAGSMTQAILACKVFIPVLSQVSVEDKQLQEELSLAYVSNSCIFPLGTTRHRFIAPKLNGGAKLILAKINWCFVLKPEDYNKNMTNLIQCINIEMKRLKTNTSSTETPASISTHGVSISLTHGLDLGGSDGYEGSAVPDAELHEVPFAEYVPFWKRHFADQTSVKWGVFKEKFLKDYGPFLEKEFQETAEEKKKLITNLMHKDVFHLSPTVEFSVFEAFSSSRKGTAHRFYRCILEYLMAYMSLREVISMDSSLRITTIQSLGKFTFPVIINGLADLLRDDDANIRAVAAIALAHAGKNHKDTVPRLVELLEDEDRLVRESACLSLGFLKAGKAVDSIVDRWRNDPISTVREAAELALSKMNVAEAQRCIKVTQILSSEMATLKPKE